MVVVNVGGESYAMHPQLKEKWDAIKDTLVKNDEDRFYITDGRERSGKSVFTLQQIAYIDPTIIEGDLPRICFTPEEFLTAIKTASPGSAILFDEAFRGLSSRSALSRVNKTIIQALQEMGQKNLVVWIVSPSFFLLELYVAMLRSNALFHIKKDDKTNKRFFKCYNYKKKAKLYQKGVKTGWEYKVYTRFKGYFSNRYPGGKEFEAKYRAKKLKALTDMNNEPSKKEELYKYKIQRDAIIANLYKTQFKTHKSIVEWLNNKARIPIQESMVREIIHKHGKSALY